MDLVGGSGTREFEMVLPAFAGVAQVRIDIGTVEDVARAASTYKIQRLGNEAGLPTLTDIEVVKMAFAARA